MFGMITPQVFWARSAEDSKFSLFNSVVYTIETRSMAFGLFWRNSFVVIPTAVELSTCIAVSPCFHPISVRVVRIGTAVCELTKMVPYYASAADDMMLRMILHTTSMMPLTVVTKSSGFLGLGGPLLIKWTPLARILAYNTERYDESECMVNCIPLTLY